MTGTSSIPLSAAELSEAMREARPYDASRLDRVLGVDERHGLVEVQAATPWKAIAAGLRPGDARAAAIRTTMATVGESLAANAAGPDGRPTVMHVESFALVAPNGGLRRVSRSSNREMFALVAGGHDLFGALYSVTLDMGSLTRAVNEAATTEVIAPVEESTARPMQLLLPPEALDAFLEDARGHCVEWRMPLRGIELRRTQQEEDSFLRWARRDYAVVTLYLGAAPALGAAMRATQLRQALLDAAIARGGSFPLWETPEVTRAQLDACYPELRAFLAEKRRVDPAERLVNPWYRHYRALLEREACEVRFSS